MKNKSELYKIYVRTSAIGLECGLSIIFGLVSGYYADIYMELDGLFMLIGFFVGIIASIRVLYGFMRNYLKENA